MPIQYFFFSCFKTQVLGILSGWYLKLLCLQIVLLISLFIFLQCKKKNSNYVNKLFFSYLSKNDICFNADLCMFSNKKSGRLTNKRL